MVSSSKSNGGTAPLGYAVVIALTIIVAPGTFAFIVALALLWTVPVLIGRRGVNDAGRSLLVWTLGCAAALATNALTRNGVPIPVACVSPQKAADTAEPFAKAPAITPQ